MTKQHEIEILRECAEKLGRDSYCQAWLLDQIPFIENDMRCDILPQTSWSETRKLEQNTLRLANEQAARIIEMAEVNAETIKKQASQWAKELKIKAIDSLKKAIVEISEN